MIHQIVNAEYRIEQERTLPVIASEILQIERNVCSVAIDGAIQIGRKLQEAKEKVEHGHWEDWCRDNLNYSKRQAENFVKISLEYGDENSPYAKAQALADFSYTKALRLLSVPEDEVETFVKEHDVESMTTRELEAEIKQLKQKNNEAEEAVESSKVEIGQLKSVNECLNDEIASLKAEVEAAKEADGDSEKIAQLESSVAGLEEKLEAANNKNKKQKEQIAQLKDDAKKEQDQREADIRIAIEKSNAEARTKAQEEVQAKTSGLEKKVEELEKRIANSSDESKLLFKLKVDQLQHVWNECVELVEDDEKKKNALGFVLGNMEKSLRG